MDEKQIKELLESKKKLDDILAIKEKENLDALEKEKIEKIKKEILDSIAPERKKVEFVSVEPEKPEAGVKYCKSFGEFMWMVKTGDPRLKTAMSTTSAQGGYTIPEGWSKEIVNSLNNYAAAPGMVTQVTMGEPTLHLNSLLTDLTVAWSTEATAKSTTKPTFSQADLTLRFLYALITLTKELSQDSMLNLGSFLKDLVTQNIALELEAQILQANAAPFTGILNAAGVNAVAQVGANLSYSDLTAVVNNTGQLEQYKKGAGWWMTRGALDVIINLMDNNNRPLINLSLPLSQDTKSNQNQIPINLLGYPVYISDQITDTLSEEAGSTSIAFGNLKNVWMGKKAGHEGLEVLVTDTGVINSGVEVTENALTENKQIYRFEIRRGIIVAVPAAFVKLTGVTP